VIEAMNPDRRMFQLQGLMEVLSENRSKSPHALIKEVRRRVTEFAAGAPQSDDITMLAARIG
jgi:sigma-B regulation protein RsbU (phosphoserine phosphatase)